MYCIFFFCFWISYIPQKHFFHGNKSHVMLFNFHLLERWPVPLCKDMAEKNLGNIQANSAWTVLLAISLVWSVWEIWRWTSQSVEKETLWEGNPRLVRAETSKHPMLCLVLFPYYTEILMSFDAIVLFKLVEREERKTACLQVRCCDGTCIFQRWCSRFYRLWETLAFQKFIMNSMILLIC